MENTRTILAVKDTDSGEVIPVDVVLRSTESTHLARRASFEQFTYDGTRRSGYRFQCGLCRTPVYVAFHVSTAWAWFNHLGKPAVHCDWYEKKKLSKEMVRAIIYNGQQESPEHIRFKNFIADRLERNTLVSAEVRRDLFEIGKVLLGERKRPDVACTYAGKRLVFELQLTYTFIEDIVRRDEFYRQEQTFLIWVFRRFEPERVTSAQEYLHNRGNLFVLDDDAVKESESSGQLVLKCHYLAPIEKNGEIVSEWNSRFVCLEDLQFPTSNYRPYLYDFSEQKIALARAAEESGLRVAVTDFLVAITDYHLDDYPGEGKAIVCGAAQRLAELGYPEAREAKVWGHRGLFSKLLSLKAGKPIGYKTSLIGVLNAAVTPGSNLELAFPVVLAAKVYADQFLQEHEASRRKLMGKYRAGLKNHDSSHRREPKYDRLIALCFPELASGLQSNAGLQMAAPIAQPHIHSADNRTPTSSFPSREAVNVKHIN